MPRKQQSSFRNPAPPSNSSRACHSTAIDESFNPSSEDPPTTVPDWHLFASSSPGVSRISLRYGGNSIRESSSHRNGQHSGGSHPAVASAARLPLQQPRPMDPTVRDAAVTFSDPGPGHSSNDTTLAMDVNTHAKLGCAYFSSNSNTLFLLQEVASVDMASVDQLLFHAQPAVVLISARAPVTLVQHLERLAAPDIEGPYLILLPHRKSPDSHA